jgi:hypothetical protein
MAQGYVLLSNSFQGFFYDTLAACHQAYADPQGLSRAPYQPTYFLSCLTLFRSCRAAENLLYQGYPLEAFSLLRDMSERALLLSGWTRGLTNFKALNATRVLSEEGNEDRENRLRKEWEKEERRVIGLLIGRDSGLPPEVVKWLARWRAMFHMQVHGSRMTAATEFGKWLMGKSQLSIGPIPSDDSVTMYINSAPEVHWMILRLLPFLQLSPGAFGSSWASRWTVLNESFDFYQAGFEALGKPVGTAVRRLIENKFELTPNDTYVELSPDEESELKQ